MKQLFIYFSNFFLLSAVLFVSCQSQEDKTENKFTDCFCNVLSGKEDTTGKMMEDGIIALDNFLRKSGKLGAGKMEDYQKLAMDTNVIVIPSDADSINYIKFALFGSVQGAPDTRALGDCIKTLAEQSKNLDTTSAAFIVSKEFKAMENAGAPDSKAFFTDFFSKVTEQEFEKPFSKEIFYFMSNFMTPQRFVIANGQE